MNRKVIYINGGTGFIGRALCSALLKEKTSKNRGEKDCDGAPVLSDEFQYQIYVQTRRPSHHRHRAITFVSSYLDLPENIAPDVIINLAGAPIADGRWTKARKKLMRESRIRITENLFNAVKSRGHSPSLLNASAIGYYGDRGDEEIVESADKGEGFAADLCDDWEKSARLFEQLGSRICIFRIGVVLGSGGGVLEKLVPIFRLGMGGPIGSGKQWMSWVHIDDLVNMFTNAITDDRYQGVVNGTAPGVVRQAEFAKALGAVLGRPAFMPTPALVMKLVYGQMAEELLLGGQRVLPRRASDMGYTFEYPNLEQALKAVHFENKISLAKP